MYSSQELYRAQNCPYTLPSFNSSNSSHGCHYTCCADRLTPAPPLPPAPETRHPELKLLMFPSDLPLLRFSHLSERAPLASVLPGVGAPNGGILLSSSHRTFNPTLRPQFYSHLQRKPHPLSPESLWRPPPTLAQSPATPVLLTSRLCSEPSVAPTLDPT